LPAGLFEGLVGGLFEGATPRKPRAEAGFTVSWRGAVLLSPDALPPAGRAEVVNFSRAPPQQGGFRGISLESQRPLTVW